MLQGGGALGSYQCGVYEAMHAADLRPDWVAGVSIGAVNAAIIAGNAPEHRVERLRSFWETVCEPLGIGVPIAAAVRALLEAAPSTPALHAWANSLGALGALVLGQQGFFHPRLPSPLLFDDGSARATSFYDPSPLRATLLEHIDFDRLNARGMYWNNRAGWVPRQQASRFSAAAKRAQSALPGVGSTWVCATRRA